MDAEAALAWLDTIIPAQTGERLSDLQKVILQQVWLGRKYLDIARAYGCTEGHVKDVGSQLWKLLSQVLRQKITKSNCRANLERALRKTTVISGLIDYSKSPQSLTLKPEDSNFLGREDAIAHLNALVNQGSKVIVIQGEGGLGKTTLAQQYLQTQGFELVLELLMAKETQNITSAERVVEEWLKQDFGEEPGMEFGVTLGRLKRQLDHRRIGVLIDNLEPALDQQGKLIPPHRNYLELLRVLTDVRVQSVTLITSRDRLCEPGLNVHHYRLPGLDQSAWLKFFSNRRLTINLPTLQQMHRTYGGNAKAMGILCGAMQEDFGGDMALYWQENHGDPLAATDLKNLAVSQINRLPQSDNKHQVYYLRMLEVDSLLSIGLYKIDLWELEAAVKLFKQVIYLAQNTDHHRWAEKSSVCLALVYSYLGFYDTSHELANVAYENLKDKKSLKSGRFAYFMQILGQTYVNLGDFSKANQMFSHALTFAEASHYIQVKAKTLNGLAEIYRQQADYKLAVAHHTEAIELLEKIGAKCDLAEAYFQLGLTYQKLAKTDISQMYFHQAIQLFTEIKAPKQIAKIFLISSDENQNLYQFK